MGGRKVQNRSKIGTFQFLSTKLPTQYKLKEKKSHQNWMKIIILPNMQMWVPFRSLLEIN
jgi:hypothetical protein